MSARRVQRACELLRQGMAPAECADRRRRRSPELSYIRDTIVEFLPTLSDPRAGSDR